MTEKKNTIRRICNQIYAKDINLGSLTGSPIYAYGLGMLAIGRPELAITCFIAATSCFTAPIIIDDSIEVQATDDPIFNGNNPLNGHVMKERQKKCLINSMKKTMALEEKMRNATSVSKRKKIQKKLDRENRFRSDVLSTGNIVRANPHSTLKI